ncbi:hypothetical protein A2348_01700 [Candidatus Uhrbacteria bacterium RIFOXYB12_FULL_58_10]|uniref:Ribonuclease n=1 Tax=Candidatus Uhrbacteria bacterium RIFOXYB2_FULL_57_15 TaxID=1802422 RepID=A0A1F7WAE3_9BACT|nr:MAG: hypothetical protein A2348_01700 [Candidatus Uhrbacteria bacterium RIFOXYB12_FULL_58_10]OGL99358.1 MAG: hypothetical protein A2304_00075 [Candidatus Uhrbacteria bacterium RIFOXYB2_FULL_57_15]OGM00490.1 MAG: hypothetical protein A2501_00820 [Candidatus Uhrbacteria bacterium RIFOXYC12_FULL_57_11]
MGSKPTFLIERELVSLGFRAIVGVDEAGCGSLAGPLVAAAVILPLDSRLGGVNDSKRLSPSLRDGLYEFIFERARAKLAVQFPEYGFEIHKGYATKGHKEAIKKHGACSAYE